jgi:hypothetical protein
MARGGRRTGTPGTAYSNRTDLQKARLPVQTGPSAQYGESAKLEQAQKTVPMATPPLPQGGPAESPQSGPMGMEQAPLPGQLGDIMRPTERPNEPVTAGIPSGPGPGPSLASVVPTSAADLLNVLSQDRNVSPEIQYLNDWLRGGRG